MIYSLLIFAAALPQVPNAAITPGDVDPKATKAKVCTVGYTSTVRDVPESKKKEVFAEYKIDRKSSRFEVDHLISLELGGSNDIKNLWPQSYTTQPWNAYKKDRLENKLHSLVCSGNLELVEAQRAIATDWIRAYSVYVGK